MKKFLVLMLILFMATPAFASKRGALTNVFASWVTVAANTTTVMDTPPFNSRDVYIQNGSAIDVCINLRGGTIGQTCYSFKHHVVQLGPGDHLFAQDFITDAISFRSPTEVIASPISVLITY